MNVVEKHKTEDAALTESLLEELPDNFLGCRDLRHAWAIDTDFHLYDDPKNNRLMVVSRDLICLRCNTTRREVYVQRKWGLDKIRNNYTYADGYQLKGVPQGTKAASVVHDVMYKKAMAKVAELAITTGTQTPASAFGVSHFTQ